MAEPTLAQVFGSNATQTSTTLTITKADLASTGFTPNAANTAESLLAAILAFAGNSLTESNQNSNPDQSIVIDNSFPSVMFRNNVNYYRKTKSISFDKIDANASFNPNDY